MLDLLTSLKPHIPWINLVLNFVGIVGIPLLIVLGILKPYSDPKARIKQKIIQKLIEEANKGEFLFPEIKLRDNLFFTSLKYRIFSKKFYTLFIESIRELTTEKEIIRVDNYGLEFFSEDRQKNYPLYFSKAKKTPADYDLKEDEPNRYLGLNSQEVQELVKSLKANEEASRGNFLRGVEANM
jgi:hypothetical protein